MVCIYCGQSTSVVNSRLQKRHNKVWRRRRCNSCGAVFTTLETHDDTALMVKSGENKRLEPFYRDKLFISVYESCKHRRTALKDARALTDTAIGKLFSAIEGGILSKADIRKITSETLTRFDKVAGTYYRAYYVDNR